MEKTNKRNRKNKCRKV